MARSSSTSSSDHRSPALAFRWLALACLVALLGFELAVRVLYSPPAPMRDKAIEYEASPHGGGPELVILGTCLPEAIIQPEILGDRLGGNTRIYNLATPAGTARLWVLFLRHHVPAEAQIEALLIPFGAMDLTKLMAPWESQAMELATWGDVPDMVDWACDDLACGAELTLRKGYRTYRHRGYFANWFWAAMGTRAPIPGSMLSPGDVDPSDRMVDGGPQLAWGAGPKPVEPTDPTRFVYLEELLALSAEMGIPAFFTPLPTRAKVSGHGGMDNPEYRRVLIETIEGGGGRYLDLASIPGLAPSHFEDDVHLTGEGRALVTVALGDAMARELGR